MLPGFARQTLTVERAPLIDDGHGNQVRDWAHAVSHDVTGCSIQPGATSADLDHRDAASIAYTVWAPVDADILPSDRVALYGENFLIDGDIPRWATGILDHAIVYLKRWEG